MRCVEQDFQSVAQNTAIDWEALAGSTVLVTGATGLVGSLLVKALLYKNGGMKVLALIRNREKAKKVFAEEWGNPRLQFLCADITEEILIDESVDYILHGASVTASKYMVSNPVETLTTAIEGTRNMLELARSKQVKSMVYISSMEAYGITDPEKKKITEKDLGYIDILNPRSSYSEGKRICECLCGAYASQHGVPVKIARLAQTFGAGVSAEDTRVFAQFAKSALSGRDIVLHTQGLSYGNYCYTADVLSGLLCILTKGEDKQAYTVVNEETTMQIKDMAKLVATEIAGGNIQVVIDIPENAAAMGYAPDSTMKLSSEKLRNLGWKPTYDLKSMYERMMKDWQ